MITCACEGVIKRDFSCSQGGGGPLSARLGKKGSKKGSRRTRRSSGSEAEDLSALLEADLHKAEMSGRTEAANRDSFADSKV